MSSDECPGSPGARMTKEQRAEWFPVAPPVAPLPIINPKGLPLWKGKKGARPAWKGQVGVLYWHPVHKCQVVGAARRNTAPNCIRACGICNKMTRKMTEDKCSACGGMKQKRLGCQAIDATTDAACTRCALHNDNGLRLCDKHWIEADVENRACPECQSQRRNTSRDDGLCSNCIRLLGRPDVLNKYRPQLEEIMTTEGIEEWPGMETAAVRTRYAMLNVKDAWYPHVVVKTSAGPKRACEVQGCCNMAQPTDGGTAVRCSHHGGGVRCYGIDGSGCPTGTCITKSKTNIWYDGLCVRCFCDAFPNEPRAINARRWHKAREQEVVAVLTAAFPDRAWTLDKGFAKGVLQRPDMRINAAKRRIVLVEIDEDSHRTYECRKERDREAVFLANAPLGATIVMLRFNPDHYTDYDGVKHPSCFKFNPTSGTVVVEPKQRKQWDARCEALIATVRNYLDPGTEVPPPEADRVIFSHELFYDDISGAPGEDIERARAKKRKLGKLRGKHNSEASSSSSSPPNSLPTTTTHYDTDDD